MNFIRSYMTYFRGRDKIYIATFFLLMSMISIIGWLLIQQRALFFTLAVMLSLSMLVQTIYYLKIQLELNRSNDNYLQVESLFYLFSTLKYRHPLPPMRGWAISPDFANAVISLIRECRPKLVLEIGSGVSTLISAYSLEQSKEGMVVSLDHEEQFAVRSAASVVKHGLQNIATVYYAPLKEFMINGKAWLWYDTNQLKNLKSIDMLIIDGPPEKTQKLARYPALPILFSMLSDDAVILVDDADRADETEMVKRWLKEFPDFFLETIGTEKGTAILRRKH